MGTISGMTEKRFLFEPDPVGQGEEHALFFVQTWAEAVLRQVERVREAQEKSDQDFRNYERAEDWSPTDEELERNVRTRWAENHALVWSTYQLARWRKRLAEERGQPLPEEDVMLKTVRDALEHLDEAKFINGRAQSPEEHERKQRSQGRALRDLGDGLSLDVDTEVLFGRLSSTEIKRLAFSVVEAVEDELMQPQVDSYIDSLQE